jgi:hypothetical protein
MSGVVSYDLFTSKLGTGGIGLTSEGGMYISILNATGAVSVKGTIVGASTTTDNAVMIAPANYDMPIGAIYEDGIANGALVKVVVSGKAQILLKDGLASTNGYWCGVSDTAGRMYQTAAVPATIDHNKEIGHSIQAVVSGTNVLSYVVLHFN